MFLILLTTTQLKFFAVLNILYILHVNNSAGQIQKNVADISVPIHLEEIELINIYEALLAFSQHHFRYLSPREY